MSTSAGTSFLTKCLVVLLIAAFCCIENASPVAAAAPAGTIAYIRDSVEIRLVEADGKNDRLLWKVPDGSYGRVSGLAWHPNGTDLAFTSSHDQVCSMWDADVYLIAPSGRNLRKLTNAPSCDALGAYTRGSVRVRLENYVGATNQFIVYVMGASAPQSIVMSAGTVHEIVFSDVADLGSGMQQHVVVISGNYRWFNPAVFADVQAGQTVSTAPLRITANGFFEKMGAAQPSWSSDGSQIGFLFGGGIPWIVSSKPQLLAGGSQLLGDGTTVIANWVAMSPKGGEILYEHHGPEATGIYRAGVGKGQIGTLQVETTLSYGISWLPDGSGFVYADVDGSFTSSNLFLYTFSTGKAVALTRFSTEYVGQPSVSPDGQYIVFSYSAQPDGAPPVEIRRIRRDGSDMQILSSSGLYPVWSPARQLTVDDIRFVIRTWWIIKVLDR